jgi:hypothetical protein
MTPTFAIATAAEDAPPLEEKEGYDAQATYVESVLRAEQIRGLSIPKDLGSGDSRGDQRAEACDSSPHS